MRYFFLVILFLNVFYSLKGQNLVPNPSFEEFDLCNKYIVGCGYQNPSSKCSTSCCVGVLPERPNQPNSSTHNWWGVNLLIPPNYINDCTINYIKNYFFSRNDHSGANYNWYTPRTGNAFIMMNTFGIQRDDTTNFRQYAQVKLTDSLKAGCNYEVSCFALLTKYYGNALSIGGFFDTPHQTASDGLGMYLAKDSLYITDYRQQFQALTDVIPQVSNSAGHLLTDTINYQKVSGIYKAQGGEQWLVIGNFKDNAHTQSLANNYYRSRSVYSIDDVCVQLWRPDLVAMTDTTICIDSSFVLTLPEGLSDYLWSTGETTKQITITQAGNYFVQASNGCEILHDQFTVHSRLRYTNVFLIGKDTFFCKVPANYPLTAPDGLNHYTWSTGATTNSIFVNASGEYWVKASYECGTLSDTISITQFPQPDTLLIPDTDTSICSNQSLDIKVYHQTNYTSFVWNNGSSQNHLSIIQPGTYTLKATTANGCEVKDTLEITMIYPPTLRSFPDTVACEGTSFYLSLHPTNQEQVQWYDGSSKVSHEFNRTGTYWVSLSNTCYSSTDSIKTDFLDCTLNIPNLLTNNGDGINDYFVIQTNIPRILNLTVYNSWGNEIFKEDDYQNQWGNSVNDGIYFYQINDPLLNKNYKGWVQVTK